MSVQFNVTESVPMTALVSFPQGVPWSLDEMRLSIKERPSKKSKRKRMIVGTLNNIQYHGTNYTEGEGLKDDVSRYAIGLYDEKTKKIEVLPLDHPYVLRPQLQVASSGRETSIITDYERKQSLTEAFGSKKKKRAQRAAASNIILTENISGVDAIEEVMKLIDEDEGNDEIDKDGSDLATAEHRLQMLPFHDTTTDELNKCYPLDKLIPIVVITQLYEMYTQHSQHNSEGDLVKFWETEFSKDQAPKLLFSLLDLIKDSLIKSTSNSKSALKHDKKSKHGVSMLMYLWFAMELYNQLNANSMKIEKDVFQAIFKISSDTDPHIITRYFQDTFLGYRNIHGKGHVTSTKLLMDKLLYHILVTALTCAEYKVNLSIMALDLKTTVQKLLAVSRELGCSAEKNGSQFLTRLNAPLVFPKVKKIQPTKKK